MAWRCFGARAKTSSRWASPSWAEIHASPSKNPRMATLWSSRWLNRPMKDNTSAKFQPKNPSYLYTTSESEVRLIDPRGRPTVTAGSDHCFHKCRPSVRPSPLSKQNKFQAKTMFATGETVGLAEWIYDDTCLVLYRSWSTRPTSSPTQ